MTLFVRSITSLCYAALLLGSLYLDTTFFTLVVFAMATLSLLEIQRITNQKSLIVFLLFPAFLLFSHFVEYAFLALLLLGIIGILLMTNFYWSKRKISFTKTFVTVLGVFGVSVPLV
ncbi:MAG: hypothetical protein ACPGYI_05785, partial [Flavobacteriaceae bacterium]